MFKKRSKPKKASLRRKQDDEDDDQDEDTRQNLQEAVQANKKLKTSKDDDSAAAASSIMHHYQISSEKPVSAAELATSTAQYHPEQQDTIEDNAGRGEDGIFRDKTRNKFHAGPIKASTFVRTTCRFDYQPDICKDYKDTGFCGFGDTCIYLHDRGDTLTGWQLEQQYEEQKKKDAQKREMEAFAMEGKTPQDEKPKVNADDGLPFACYVCREAFTEPVVTSCGHYFCEQCIMKHVRENEKGTCPICGKDTHGVFNQPTKLLMKKRRLLSSNATWQEFADASRPTNVDTKDG